MSGSKTMAFFASALLFSTRLAAAEDAFAAPPPEPLPLVLDSGRSDAAFELPQTQPSWIRFNVGPALRLSEPATDGGFFLAVDFGSRAAGARAFASWIGAGADRGLTEYAGELWIDFGVGRALHPVLGAGAGVARLDRVVDGDRRTATLGVGVLRGSLDYVLPVVGADARAGVDVIGSVPAIRSRQAGETAPWLLLAAHVGVGF